MNLSIDKPISNYLTTTTSETGLDQLLRAINFYTHHQMNDDRKGTEIPHTIEYKDEQGNPITIEEIKNNFSDRSFTITVISDKKKVEKEPHEICIQVEKEKKGTVVFKITRHFLKMIKNTLLKHE